MDLSPHDILTLLISPTRYLLYDCILLESQRRILRKNVTKTGQWPANKHELITKHLEPLITYIESIDFDILYEENYTIHHNA
jgi:hypothetical protein